jgi:hypothetical protein
MDFYLDITTTIFIDKSGVMFGPPSVTYDVRFVISIWILSIPFKKTCH